MRERVNLRSAIVRLLTPAVLMCSSPVLAVAESARATPHIMVHIRAVRALEDKDPDFKRAAITHRGESKTEVQVDPRLNDLVGKLHKLRFHCYRLISSQREIIPLGKRETVTVADGNQLTLRPLTMKENRVGMWIKWEDPTGMRVLDTRMHFDMGESVVTGVEAAANSGLILAIDVSPVESPQ